MATPINVMSNELYGRIQSNRVMDKTFKKSLIGMYKNHSNAAEKVLEVVEYVGNHNMVPNGSTLSDGMSIYRTGNNIDPNDTSLYGNILPSYKDTLESTKNVFIVTLKYKCKKLYHYIEYFLMEGNDGKMTEVYRVKKN